MLYATCCHYSMGFWAKNITMALYAITLSKPHNAELHILGRYALELERKKRFWELVG
jgi:hypothetical protein